MKYAICIVLAAFALSASSEKIRYDGYTVKRITPQTEEQLAALINLESIGAKFWHEPSTVGRHADVLLPPHMKDELVQGMRTFGMKVENFVEDVQQLIDLEESTAVPAAENRLGWTAYGTVEEINAFIREQNQKYPNITEVINIGQSFEGRDLLVLKISRGGSPKPAIWVDANIHAREWITSAVATFTINELLSGDRQGWTEDFDWYILSVLNPDGLAYTKTSDRMWRKTRSSTGGLCRGADANRNFGFHWREGGSSTLPCSDTYAGSSAFSEVESQHVRDFITSISKDLVFYLSLHSYSQIILLPFGHNNRKIPQFNDYMSLAGQISAATAARYGTRFTYGNIVDELYVASGGSMDWVKGTYNTNLTLTYEMRDTGAYGFLLPPAQIIPSSQEFLDGLAVAIAALRSGINTPDLPPDTQHHVLPKRQFRAPSIIPQPDHNTFGQVPHPRRPLSPLASFNRH
jgi:hypothetical protein